MHHLRPIFGHVYVPTSLQKLYSKCSMFNICAKTRSETNRLLTHGGNIRCACNKQKDVCCLFSDYKLSWRFVNISNLHSRKQLNTNRGIFVNILLNIFGEVWKKNTWSQRKVDKIIVGVFVWRKWIAQLCPVQTVGEQIKVSFKKFISSHRPPLNTRNFRPQGLFSCLDFVMTSAPNISNIIEILK